jgi:hypothetical protein
VIFLQRGGGLRDLAVGFLHRKVERPEIEAGAEEIE